MESLPLEIINLVKNYGSIKAVDNVSFSLNSGEIFGLLGPNGAGKTSIISILSTLEELTSGEARVFGKSVQQGDKKTKSMLGVVPQEIVSHGFFTVEEVLHFHSGYYGIKNNKTHIDFLLNKLGLYDHRDKRVRQLSGGMKRRLLIAKSLVHQPKLLLLDEPTAGVDIELRNSLWEFVEELNENGMTILLTTHYLEEAEKLCDRVGIIHHGKLLKVGDTKNLVQELTMREIILHFKGQAPKVDSIYLLKAEEQVLQFRFPNNLPIGELLKMLPIDSLQDIHIREGKLEDAFLQIVEEK